MEEENNGTGEIALESPEEITSEVVLEEIVEESIEEVKVKLAKAEELAQNQKIRAEKAEAKVKSSVAPQGSFSTRDAVAILEAKVSEEDMADVEEYATFKKVTIADALRSPVLKTLLANKAEERRVANGTNTTATRRGTSQVSDDVLVAKAGKGELPDSEEDIRRLNAIRWGLKK